MRCVRVAFVASDFCLPFPFPSSDHTAEPKRGQTLSSTEERIRRSGARGLATARPSYSMVKHCQEPRNAFIAPKLVGLLPPRCV
jgi:hypothetical protein